MEILCYGMHGTWAILRVDEFSSIFLNFSSVTAANGYDALCNICNLDSIFRTYYGHSLQLAEIAKRSSFCPHGKAIPYFEKLNQNTSPVKKFP